MWIALKTAESTYNQQSTKIVAIEKELALKASTLKALSKRFDARDVTGAELRNVLERKQSALASVEATLRSLPEGESVLDAKLTRVSLR